MGTAGGLLCGVFAKSRGYDYGLESGFRLYELCVAFGIKELTLYGFTQDNTKRPAEQKDAFQNACVKAVQWLMRRDAALLVIGDTRVASFSGSPVTAHEAHGVWKGIDSGELISEL